MTIEPHPNAPRILLAIWSSGNDTHIRHVQPPMPTIGTAAERDWMSTYSADELRLSTPADTVRAERHRGAALLATANRAWPHHCVGRLIAAASVVPDLLRPLYA